MKCIDQKKHPYITIMSILAIAILSFTGIGCGNEYGDAYKNCKSPNPGLYVEKTQSVKTTGSGELKAFVERQKEGDLSEDTLSVRYFLRNTYTGNDSVAEIKATWRVNAQFKRKTSSSYNASVGLGAEAVEVSVGTSSSVEYQDIVSKSKYFKNTNGAKEVYYGPSNYTLYPYKQLNSQSFSNIAYLKLKSHATPFSITAAV